VAETCYRHPDRETAVACSNCGRPICPDCMTSTPVGMRCPECAGERTKVRTGAAAFQSPGAPIATYVLIALNVIVFVAEIAGGGGAGSIEGGGNLINDFGLRGPEVDGGESYRVVTAGFLHAGPLHLLFNMFALYVLGSLLEPAIGTARFVAIYVVSLVAGSLGALLLTPDTLTVGASGAIYGIFAAAFLVARGRGLSGVSSEIGLWLVLNLVLTFSIPGISIGGHLGGMVGGGLAALVVLAGERAARPSRTAVVELAAMIALGAAAFGAAVAIA
jgi:membrane associated rhomboid family serine protease